MLKVHLQLRGYSVFIDVERLEAGKFDNHLLQSIKQAKNFLLVLTPKSLDRCIGDNECKDWVHKVSRDDTDANVGLQKKIQFYNLPGDRQRFMSTSSAKID